MNTALNKNALFLKSIKFTAHYAHLTFCDSDRSLLIATARTQQLLAWRQSTSTTTGCGAKRCRQCCRCRNRRRYSSCCGCTGRRHIRRRVTGASTAISDTAAATTTTTAAAIRQCRCGGHRGVVLDNIALETLRAFPQGHCNSTV